MDRILGIAGQFPHLDAYPGGGGGGMAAAAIDLRRLLADVPHDGAAIFLYALLIFCFVLIWRANRGQSDPPGGDTTPSSSHPRKESP